MLPIQDDTLDAAPTTLGRQGHLIGDEHCRPVPFEIPSFEPTGAEILLAAGRPINPNQVVLQILRTGGMEDVRLDERVDLSLGDKFVLGASDRLYRFTLNDAQFEWPYRQISVDMVLDLAGVDAQHSVELTRDGVKTVLAPGEMVDLSLPGIEQLKTNRHTWLLIVGGVPLVYTTPLVEVADAMTRAGFDTSKAWHIYLIKHGQPKTPLELTSIVDLSAPGIEKIRLTPKNVGNGDVLQPALRRQFKLLATDYQHLDSLGLRWETVIQPEMQGSVMVERRWLLLHDFPLPIGYAPRSVLMALEIPKDYPAAQVDMFYFAPFVSLACGAEIPSTQIRATIGGEIFQGWSRHRNAPHTWDQNVDNVRTHLALVEGCLLKELGE